LLSGSSGLLFPEELEKDRDILLTPDSGDAWASWAVGECIEIIAPSSLKGRLEGRGIEMCEYERRRRFPC
jgi:hypothetical protein